MDILSENQENEKKIINSISYFCKEYNLGKALKAANAYKLKGIPIMTVLMYLIQLVYTKKSMCMNIACNSNLVSFSKDVVYRFLNTTSINWAVFLLNVASQVVQRKLLALTSEKRLNVFIVDDTLFSRARSKNVELLANVHDHSNKGNSFKRGFRMLTVAWSDGVTTIPLCFRHLSSEKKSNRYNEMNSSIDKRSCGYKIRQQAISSAPTLMIDMLGQVSKFGLMAKYVLFDSWFAFPSTIIAVSKKTLKVVARIKNTDKIGYLYQGSKCSVKKIYSANSKRRGKSKYLLSVAVQLYNKEGEKIDAKIVYVRDRSNKKKWIAIISTDVDLSEEEIISLYGKRWNIEVFFKVCKSYLKLGREFQQLSYDAITAHTTVVMLRYIMIALEKRINDDPRGLGEIFYLLCDEAADISFAEVLNLLLSLLSKCLEEILFLTEEQIDNFLEKFVASIPEHLKLKTI